MVPWRRIITARSRKQVNSNFISGQERRLLLKARLQALKPTIACSKSL
jgi:hypothetical protein